MFNGVCASCKGCHVSKQNIIFPVMEPRWYRLRNGEWNRLPRATAGGNVGMTTGKVDNLGWVSEETKRKSVELLVEIPIPLRNVRCNGLSCCYYCVIQFVWWLKSRNARRKTSGVVIGQRIPHQREWSWSYRYQIVVEAQQEVGQHLCTQKVWKLKGNPDFYIYKDT